jgi:uncharacterized RmlC-like cupin family protein
MKIITKSDALHVDKPEGTSVDYYLFDEYEIHNNILLPHSIQVWHHHEKVWETIFVLSGELIVQWKTDEQEIHQVVTPGDVIETEHTPHTLLNNTDKPTTFLVIKQVLSGQNKSELLKKDKVVDE